MAKNRHTDITPKQRAARQQNAAKATESRLQTAAARRAEAAARLEDAGVLPYEVSEARLMAAKAGLAELDLAERQGTVIPVDQARADVIEAYSVVKTRLLGLPARVKQRLPHIATDDVRVIDDLVREALEELADGRATEGA